MPEPPDFDQIARADRWFVQRQHPTQAGMIQVSGPMPKAQAEAERNQLIADAPSLHPYVWQHPEDMRIDSARGGAPEPHDFDQIAQQLSKTFGRSGRVHDHLTADIVEQLRQAYNAGYKAGEQARWDPRNIPTYDDQGRVHGVLATHRSEPSTD